MTETALGESIARIVARAEATASTQFLLAWNGEILASLGDVGVPLQTMSVTKLLVGTAIGRAVMLDLLDIDVPVGDWFVEWRDDPRGKITTRHLMGHVSGLAADTWPQLDASPPRDMVAHVLADLPVVAVPVTTWAYNNAAVMLLPEIVARAASEPFLEFVRRELFDPVGVGEWSWKCDEAGHPYGMAQAFLSATGLAQVGRLLADGGNSETRRLLPPDWVATCVTSPIERNRIAGLLMMSRWASSPPVGEAVARGHDGWGGQHLWVFPRSGLVLTRLYDMSEGGEVPQFPDLIELAAAVDEALPARAR